MNGVKLSALGKAIPSLQVTNDDLSELVDTSDEWIQSRTGIQSRYIAEHETTTSLAIAAAREALTNSKLNAEDIDLVIVATVSPDYMMPSTACLVAEALEISCATCFDITAACTGFIYASEVAIHLIRQGAYKQALVIGAEVLSRTLNWEERSTCILFGDGAGAAIYSRSDEDKVLAMKTGSDGSKSKCILLPNYTQTTPYNQKVSQNPVIEMEGQTVYKFATTKVPQNIEEVLGIAACEAREVDRFIIHQANVRIVESIAKRLGVAREKFFVNLDTHGNTSGASIPMALYDAKAQLKKGDKVLISGFGAGLTWGSMLFIWDIEA